MRYQQIRLPSEEHQYTPPGIFYQNNGVYAYLSLVPYDYNHVTVVYFVSGTNGDEFGQFKNIEDAIKRAREIAGLSQSERRLFDQ